MKPVRVGGIILAVALICIILLMGMWMRQPLEDFSASDASVEMRIAESEFQTRTRKIETLLSETSPLRDSLERCQEMADWMCGMLAFEETRIDGVLARQAMAASSSQDIQKAYTNIQKSRVWTPPATLECFQNQTSQRRVPVSQQQATTELERVVLLLEEHLRGPAIRAGRKQLQKVEEGLAFLTSVRGEPAPMQLETLYSQGGCPGGMFEFGPGACCPERPTTFDEAARTFTRCGVEKRGTLHTCALSSQGPYSSLPICRPDAQQGPCPQGSFFFGAAKGGRCCPVHPTGWDTTVGDYTECSEVAKEGRVLCVPGGAPPSIAEGLPACVEGFQTMGRALLLRADKAIGEADQFLKDVGNTEKHIQAFMSPSPSPAPMQSLAPTFSPS